MIFTKPVEHGRLLLGITSFRTVALTYEYVETLQESTSRRTKETADPFVVNPIKLVLRTRSIAAVPNPV